MILYHYTTVFHYANILEHGLSKGDVPISPYTAENGVWFTTKKVISSKESHGLSELKMDIRIKVDISPKDKKLVYWPDYAASKNVNKEWYDLLNISGGNMAHTWYIYFGTIKSTKFLEILGPADMAQFYEE
jgi:hypothetical protein